MSPGDIAQLHDVIVRMRDIEQQVGRGTLLSLKASTPEVLDAGPFQRTGDTGQHVAPDLRRVVLDPGRAREELTVLAGLRGDHAA